MLNPLKSYYFMNFFRNKIRKINLFIFFTFVSLSIFGSTTNPILPPLKIANINDTLKKWTINGLSSLTFNQLSLTNWAAGGESSLAGKLFFNLNANYVNGKFSNQNAAILAYGLISSEQNKTQKTDDKIDFILFIQLYCI